LGEISEISNNVESIALTGALVYWQRVVIFKDTDAACAE